MTEPFLTLQLHLSLHPALGAHVPSTAFLPELMGARPEKTLCKKKKGEGVHTALPDAFALGFEITRLL